MKTTLFHFTATVVAGALLPVIAAAEPITVYHSPTNDGGKTGIAFLPIGTQSTLHLYLSGQDDPSAEGSACSSGTGDEHCGYHIRIEMEEGAGLLGFTARGDSTFERSSSMLSIVGGDSIAGEIGPTKLGDLLIDTRSPGIVKLRPSSRVSASLREKGILEATIAVVPEPSFSTLLGFGTAFLGGVSMRRGITVKGMNRGRR
ncbi:MAG: hypothetical protein IPK00_10285 [Deltaproteobacteria bacterium]|nr:hypothetical protein [Deltaproteobacteria bacterium]